jgi:hypothetical protein
MMWVFWLLLWFVGGAVLAPIIGRFLGFGEEMRRD